MTYLKRTKNFDFRPDCESGFGKTGQSSNRVLQQHCVATDDVDGGCRRQSLQPALGRSDLISSHNGSSITVKKKKI